MTTSASLSGSALCALSLVGNVRRPSHRLAVAKEAGCCMGFAELGLPALKYLLDRFSYLVTRMCAKLAKLAYLFILRNYRR